MNEKRRYCILIKSQNIVIMAVSPKGKRVIMDRYDNSIAIGQKEANKLNKLFGIPLYYADCKGNLYYSYPDKPISVDFNSSSDSEQNG